MPQTDRQKQYSAGAPLSIITWAWKSHISDKRKQFSTWHQFRRDVTKTERENTILKQRIHESSLVYVHGFFQSRSVFVLISFSRQTMFQKSCNSAVNWASFPNWSHLNNRASPTLCMMHEHTRGCDPSYKVIAVTASQSRSNFRRNTCLITKETR